MTSIRIQNYLQHTWLLFVALFGLAFLTSKSAISITSIVLILFAFLSSEQRQIWTSNKKVVFLVCLFPIAFLLNLFSLGGLDSSLLIIKSWPWPLLAAPAYVVSTNQRARKIFLYGLGLGLALACLYSLYLFARYFIDKVDIPFMTSNFRIRSFWDPSRWGFFAGFFVIVLALVDYRTMLPKIRMQVTLALAAVSSVFILSNTRGPFVALFLVLVSISIFKKNLRRRIGLAIILLAITFFANIGALERLTSIFAIQVNTFKITSTDPSNAGRLHMWKVGIDFFQQQPWFGTGFESTAEPLKKFIQEKGVAYSDSFTKTEFSYNDQHSSYLSMLVQMGILFFILCWIGIIYIFVSAVRQYFTFQSRNQLIFLAGLLYCFLVFVFYTAFNSYESILLFMLLALASNKHTTDLGNPSQFGNSKNL